VLVLLLFSSAETYRIQKSLSVRRAGIFREYVAQDAALRTLRQNVFLVGNYVRDFFLSTDPERAARLESDLQKARTDSLVALSGVDVSRRVPANSAALRNDLEQFWKVAESVARTMTGATDADEYAFVQREVAPRRSRLYAELVAITEADQQILQQAEHDFAASQRSALWRLLRTLTLCFGLAVLVAWFSLSHAERLEAESARQFEEVALGKRQLEQLSERLVHTEEEGRRRLSRELHDEIGQTLTALRIEIAQALKQAQTQPVKDGLSRARGLAERSIQTVRNICLLLRPALLDELGLVPALEWQVQDFSRRSGIACEFAGALAPLSLPDAVKTCVFRIAQEALHNCEKHAAAARIRVSVRHDDGVLTLEVADNGHGFTLDAKGMPERGSGLGIVGMRERVAMVGGKLRIDSAPGRGTRLTATIPASAQAPSPAVPHERVGV
jgi:signal transduction histidine kinase